MSSRPFPKRLMAVFQRMPVWRLWLLMVGCSLLLTEVVVSAMGLLLLGRVTSDYLQTGFVASVLVASLICGLILHFTAEVRRLNDTLAENEEKLRSLFELSPLGIALTDMNGRCVEFNESFRRICGYPAEELKALDHWTLTPRKYEAEEARQLESLERTGRYGPYEKECRRQDGTLVSLHLNGVVVTGHDGRRYIWSIVEDIGERKRAEQALQDSLRFARQLLEVIPNPVFYKDREGCYLGCNGAFERFLGTRREDIIGKSVYDLSPRELAERYDAADQALFASAGTQIYEACVRAADGALHDVVFHKATFARADGSLGGLVGVIMDITERKRGEESLRQSQQRFAVAFRASPVAASIARAADGCFIDVNDKYERDFGWSRAELVGRTSVDMGLWPDQEARKPWLATLNEQGTLLDFETPWRNRRGEARMVSVSAEMIDLEGEACVLAFISDITLRRQAEAQLRLAASVFASTHEGITITDAAGDIVEVNPAFCAITGYSREEVLGRNPRFLKSSRQGPEFYAAMWAALASQGYWRGEIWNRRKDGELYPELLTISTVHDDRGAVTHYVGAFADISLLKQHEVRLERMAHFDALTGIPNRVLLADRIRQAIAQTRRTGDRMAVAYLDLDGFKPINDSLGHEAGDRLLVETARRLTACVRGGDTVARLGGDEFALLLLGLERTEEFEAVLDRVLETMAQPASVAGQSLAVTASIGITIFPADDADPDTLLRHADQAMYLAKQAGRNRYHLFDPEHDRRARAHREALDRIGEAISGRELVLHYQPKVNMRRGEVVGAETLVRWLHPQKGLLPPGEFLPIIEDSDLIVALGDWVIAAALDQMAAWRRQGLDLAVSVNVAARHLQRDDFVASLKHLLAAHPDMPPQRLDLEVLETAALEDMGRVSKVIEECRALGVTFAIDDFGTGYSSLTYFKALPADTLKIDQSFVRDMLRDPDDLAIVKGVIGLTEAFHRQVIAEGVETVEHGVALLGMGCALAQGYGIARPMPPEDLPAWVRSWRPDPAWT